MKLSISARDEERCDGVVERPVDDSVHRRLKTSEYSTSLVHDGWWLAVAATPGGEGGDRPLNKKYRGESMFSPPQLLALVCRQNPEQPSTHKDAKPIDVGTML